MELTLRKEDAAGKDEAFVQCGKCHLLICKTEVICENANFLEVHSVKAVKVQYEYGECLFLCENCSAIVGQVRNGRIMLPKEGCWITRVEYRQSSATPNQPCKVNSKERYLKSLQEIMTFLDLFQSVQDRSEQRIDVLQKTLNDMLDSPLVAFLSTTDGLNE